MCDVVLVSIGARRNGLPEIARSILSQVATCTSHVCPKGRRNIVWGKDDQSPQAFVNRFVADNGQSGGDD